MMLVVAREGWSAGAVPHVFPHAIDQPVADSDGMLVMTERHDPVQNITYRYYGLDTDLPGLLHFIERNGGIAALVYPPHAEAYDGPTLLFPDTEPGWADKHGAVWEPAHWRTKTSPADAPLPPGPYRWGET